MTLSIAGAQYWPESMLLMLVILVFVTGSCIGSFLNVVIYRLPVMLQRQWQHDAKSFLDIEEDASDENQSKTFNLAFPGSACPVCKAKIKPWQNIPILSYLLLRGKCHSCKTTISIRYPLVELLTGFITVGLLLLFGLTYQFGAVLVLTYISIALFGIDADHQLLPDDLTMPLVWLGLLVNSQALFVTLDNALWGAVLGYGVLWSVFWIFKLFTGKEGMGYGDFKLLAAYGAWFGIAVLPNTILLSSLIGSVAGGWLIWRKGHNSQTPIPFGPFIILAGWLTAIFPEQFTLMNYIR
jgi:leader peptidase (prepilin peptidase) / N-methyltransferase